MASLQISRSRPSIETLVEVKSNSETPPARPAARVAAPYAILDRGFGKPMQPAEADAHGTFRLSDLAVAQRETKANMNDARRYE